MAPEIASRYLSNLIRTIENWTPSPYMCEPFDVAVKNLILTTIAECRMPWSGTRFVSVADAAYNDTQLTEEEAENLERMMADGSCRLRFDVNLDHIVA